jgi:hypothetical protein
MRPGRFAPLALAALVSACGSDPVTADPDAGEPDASLPDSGTPDSGTAGGGGRPAKCEDGPGYVDPSYPALEVGEVTAHVETVDGEPAADALVEVCGINVCTRPQYTDENGDVSVVVDTPTQKPAVKYGDAYRYGEVALLFDEGGTDFGTLYVPRLPEAGAPLLPGLPAKSGGVTVTLPEGGRFELDPFAPYDTDEGRAFRAGELPKKRWPAGLDQGAKLELIFTLAPLGARLCPPASIELPNSAGWDAGTEVELLLQGMDPGLDPGAQLFAPYGEWQPFATGIVSDDGDRIELSDGALPVVTNVGVRRR